MASNEWNKEQRELEKEDQRIRRFTRLCHDCGKPTSNYRCDKCRAKWCIKHGVTDMYDPE